jgi:hypothetical protein
MVSDKNKENFSDEYLTILLTKNLIEKLIPGNLIEIKSGI